MLFRNVLTPRIPSMSWSAQRRSLVTTGSSCWMMKEQILDAIKDGLGAD